MTNLKAIAGNIVHKAIEHKKPLAITVLAVGILVALGVVLHLYLNLITAICVPLGLLILSGGAVALYKKIKNPTVDPDLDKAPPSVDPTATPSPSDEIARAAEQVKQEELQRAYQRSPISYLCIAKNSDTRLDRSLIIMPNHRLLKIEDYLNYHDLLLESGESLLVLRGQRILLAFRTHERIFQIREMINKVSLPLNESQIKILKEKTTGECLKWRLVPRRSSEVHRSV